MNNTALTKIHYGMFVISTSFEGKNSGQIANTVFQITADPVTVALSISKQNNTHFFLEQSRKFTVSCLTEETPFEFIGKFGFKSSRDFDKFAQTKIITGKNGMPIVADFTNAYMEAEIISSLDAITHTLFLSKVTDAEVLNEQISMTYDYYHKVKKGLTPKNAPTFISK